LKQQPKHVTDLKTMYYSHYQYILYTVMKQARA